jgi:hypothetical protein
MQWWCHWKQNILSPASDILCMIFRDMLIVDVTTLAQTGMDNATCLNELSMKLEAKGVFSDMNTIEVRLSLLHKYISEQTRKSFSI